jgi:predicted hydrocarbon binding protein
MGETTKGGRKPMTDLPVPVEVDPRTGIWSVDGQPMLLVPRHFFVFIQQAIERRVGLETATAIYHEASHDAARLWCEREAKTHGLDGLAVFRHYLARMSSRGYGQLTIEALDAEAGRASIRLDHSAFAAEYGSNAGRKVCVMFPPAFLGAFAFLAERAGATQKLLAEETQCAAEGAPCCRFEVRPAS